MNTAPFTAEPTEINLPWFRNKYLRELIPIDGCRIGACGIRVDTDLLTRMIPCAVTNCTEIYRTTAAEIVSLSSKYVCKHHNRKSQIEAFRQYEPSRRSYDSTKDNRDKQIAFDKTAPSKFGMFPDAANSDSHPSFWDTHPKHPPESHLRKPILEDESVVVYAKAEGEVDVVPSRRMSGLLWKITGTYNSILAKNKFAVFSFVSSLLAPKAAKIFRRTLRDERVQVSSRKRSMRILNRDDGRRHRFDDRINKLVAVLLRSLRREKNDSEVFRPPHWTGEHKPQVERYFLPHSNFPRTDYLTHLVQDLGYDSNAAFAAMTRTHLPWLSVDRRRRSVVKDGDEQPNTEAKASVVCVVHPYVPAAPSRRTKVGGGLTKEQVRKALAKKRWDPEMKQAVFEIVYRRRSTLEVSNETGKPIETLYVYASRLRQDLQEPDLYASRNVA